MTQAARQSDPLVEGKLSTLYRRAANRPDGPAALAEAESSMVAASQRQDRYWMRRSDWLRLRDKYRPKERCEPKLAKPQVRLNVRRPSPWQRLRHRLLPGEMIAAVSKLMGIAETEGCGCRSLRKRMNKMGWLGTLRWLRTDEGRRWLACVPKRIDGINCTWLVEVE